MAGVYAMRQECMCVWDEVEDEVRGSSHWQSTNFCCRIFLPRSATPFWQVFSWTHGLSPHRWSLSKPTLPTHIKCSLPDRPVSKSAQTARLNLMVTLKSCFETVAMETVQTCLAHVLGHGRIQRVPACAHVMHACTPQFSPQGRATPRRTSQSCHCTECTGRNPGL